MLPPLDELSRLFREAASGVHDSAKDQLTFADMHHLADTFIGWAMSSEITPEQSAALTGWAEALQTMAEKVGPEWNPPEPPRVSLIGSIARRLREP